MPFPRDPRFQLLDSIKESLAHVADDIAVDEAEYPVVDGLLRTLKNDCRDMLSYYYNNPKVELYSFAYDNHLLVKPSPYDSRCRVEVFVAPDALNAKPSSFSHPTLIDNLQQDIAGRLWGYLELQGQTTGRYRPQLEWNQEMSMVLADTDRFTLEVHIIRPAELPLLWQTEIPSKSWEGVDGVQSNPSFPLSKCWLTPDSIDGHLLAIRPRYRPLYLQAFSLLQRLSDFFEAEKPRNARRARTLFLAQWLAQDIGSSAPSSDLLSFQSAWSRKPYTGNPLLTQWPSYFSPFTWAEMAQLAQLIADYDRHITNMDLGQDTDRSHLIDELYRNRPQAYLAVSPDYQDRGR